MTGRAPSDLRRSAGPNLLLLSQAAAIGTVLSQIGWVLLAPGQRDVATAACVALFATASVSHAAATRGLPWTARYALIAGGVGWAAEAIGTTTGWPFGSYGYQASLSPLIGPVPLVVPLAWVMMAYPVLLAARRVTRDPVGRTCYAAALLTAWDLFLDPQMVAQGYWAWSDDGPWMPGVAGIPAQNFAGWFLIGGVLFGLAAAFLWDDGEPHDDRVPALLLMWVYTSNVLANAVFWGRGTVALIGGAAMGLLLWPWLASGVAAPGFWRRA